MMMNERPERTLVREVTRRTGKKGCGYGQLVHHAAAADTVQGQAK